MAVNDPTSPLAQAPLSREVIVRNLFLRTVLAEADQHAANGTADLDLVAHHGTVRRILRMDWLSAADRAFYFRQRDTNEQSESSDGNGFLLQALLAMPADVCPIPLLQREAWQFADFLFADPVSCDLSRKPALDVKQERRFAALRRRMQMWITATDQATSPAVLFRRAMDRFFGSFRLSDYNVRRASLSVVPSESIVDLFAIRRCVAAVDPELRLQPITRHGFSMELADEVTNILTNQRTGVFLGKDFVGIYLPTYIETLFDMQHSFRPVLDWSPIMADFGSDILGMAIPDVLKDTLRRKLRTYFADLATLVAPLEAKPIWEKFTQLAPYSSTDTLVLRITSLKRAAFGGPMEKSAEDPAAGHVSQLMPRPPRKEYRSRVVLPSSLSVPAEAAQALTDGRVVYHWTPTGAFVDPACFKFITSPMDMKERFYKLVDTRRAAGSRTAMELVNNNRSKKNQYRMVQHKVNGVEYIHIGTLLEMYALEIPEALHAHLYSFFTQARSDVIKKSREQEVLRKRALGHPVRAAFGFTLMEDAILKDAYKRYASEYYWKGVLDRMPRHSLTHIKRRTHLIHHCLKAGMIMDEIRRPELVTARMTAIPQYLLTANKSE